MGLNEVRTGPRSLLGEPSLYAFAGGDDAYVGAKLGVGLLWVVSAILGAAISVFLLGQGPESIRPDGLNLTTRIEGGDAFGIVFATCFPAFTGMIAGLGLSGDLRNPQKSIPLGTIGATLAGMVVYALVAVKLAQSATPEALAGDQFIMARIALWGPAIYVGLGAAALSSALGSILVAPRTLQALSRDNVLPVPKLKRFLKRGRGKAREPVRADDDPDERALRAARDIADGGRLFRTESNAQGGARPDGDFFREPCFN